MTIRTLLQVIILPFVVLAPTMELIRLLNNPAMFFEFVMVCLICIVVGSVLCENLWSKT